MLRILYLFLSLSFVFNLGFAQRRLAINGFSTAACAGSSNNSFCWVNLLTNHYASQGQPITLLNTATFGENIYHCMPTGYIPPLGRPAPNVNNNITNSLNWNPNVVLINYPTNWFDVYTITEIMACFRRIRSEAQAAGKILYATTTQPRTGFTAAGRERLRIIKDSIIEQFGVYAINFWDGIADPVDNTILPQYRYCCDDIHLNDAAHQILFQRVRDKNIFSAQSPLPLYSAELNANVLNTTVKLEAVIKGTDLQDAELQRGNDGINFSTVHRFNDLQPDKTNYLYEDKQPLRGNNYYRLKVTEASGRVVYSQLTIIKVNSTDFVIEKLFADASKVLNIHFSTALPATGSRYDISVISTGGSVVLHKNYPFAQSGILQIALPQCSPGVYVLRLITAEGKVVTGKFIIR